jgi:hypothetical protein
MFLSSVTPERIGSRFFTGMGAGYGFAATRTLHTAQIGSFAKILYPYHPLFGKELEVLGVAGGVRDLVYVRLPNRMTRGIPAWMFDEIICSRVQCAEQPTVDCRALLGLAHLLDSARSVPRSARREFTIAKPPRKSSASQPPSSASSGGSGFQCAPPRCDTAQMLASAAGTAPEGRPQRKTPKRKPR